MDKFSSRLDNAKDDECTKRHKITQNTTWKEKDMKNLKCRLKYMKEKEESISVFSKPGVLNQGCT